MDPAGPDSLLKDNSCPLSPRLRLWASTLTRGTGDSVKAESKKQRCRFPDNACTSMHAGGLGTEPAHNRVLLKEAEMEAHPTEKAMGQRSQVEVSQTRGLRGALCTVEWEHGAWGCGDRGALAAPPSEEQTAGPRAMAEGTEPRALGVRGG